MSDELNRINPTVVEGAEDIHGAEGHDAEMYSPMMQNRFAFRDAMRRSRDTLTEKQVGDLMRMRRFGRGSYGAESKFDELSDEIAEQYEKKGMSKEEAEKIGDATAYKVGVAKFGKKGMEKKAKVGMDKKKMKAHEAEGLGNILGDIIPQPHFMGMEEIIREKNKNQNMKDAQGYDDKLDESMGMSMRESKMKQSMKDRRDESKGMEKGMGRRAYQRVKTMDMDAQGYDDKLDESMGMSMRESKMKQSMKDRRDESKGMEKGMGRRAYQRVKTMDMDAQGYDDKLDESMGMSMKESKMKQSMKDRRDESKGMEKGMGRRAYQRVKTMDKDSESFEANEEAVEQTDANMVNEGSVDAFYGSGAKVDTSSIELQPIANPSVDEAFDVGNDVGIDVAEQEVMNVNPSVEVNYGAEDDKYVVVKRPHHMARVPNLPSKIYNKKMIESSKPGGYHNQMYREGKMYDDETGGWIKITDEHRGNIIDTTQDLLAKGGVRVGGMTASALVIAVAGLSGYYFAKR